MTSTASPLRSSWPARLASALAGLLAVGVGFYGLAYLARGLGGVPPGVRVNAAGGYVLLTHAALAGVALVCGPWQFIATWRYSARRPHRWIGRVYVAACLFGGVTGAALALGTVTGPVARYGFLLLGVAWLVTTALGWTAARRRDFAAHRRWMIRSFALTFAAVTLRLYLPASMMGGLAFTTAYPVIAWLCWVPNLLAAELWLRARPLPPFSGKATRQAAEEAP